MKKDKQKNILSELKSLNIKDGPKNLSENIDKCLYEEELNNKKYFLEKLVNKIKEENVHSESFKGKSYGREVW